MKVKLKEIVVEGRFREDYGDVESLAVSIQRYGLAHPIVVRKEGEKIRLIAGERRLKAHELLGMEEVEVKFMNELTELEARELEIEENIKRKDFTWQEEVKAKSEVDEIKRKLYGAAIKGHGGGWGLEQTAQSLGESVGTVSQDIRLAKAIEEFPELASEKNKASAWKKYQRLKERALVSALVDKTKIVAGKECVKLGSSEQLMKNIASISVDLVVTDPPFAIDLDKGTMKSEDYWAEGGIYDDEYQHVLNTIGLVAKECYRVLKNDRCMYMFFGVQHYEYVHKMLVAVGFHVNPVPLIWHKTGGAGAGGSDYAYASNYEACFFCMKGRRALAKLGESNVFTEPRVAPQRKIHPTEKPTQLLRRLIEQSSNPGELVIDPFAGSGSTLIAAFECGRQALGIEQSATHYGQALLRIEEYIKGEVLAEPSPIEGEPI